MIKTKIIYGSLVAAIAVSAGAAYMYKNYFTENLINSKVLELKKNGLDCSVDFKMSKSKYSCTVKEADKLYKYALVNLPKEYNSLLNLDEKKDINKDFNGIEFSGYIKKGFTSIEISSHLTKIANMDNLKGDRLISMNKFIDNKILETYTTFNMGKFKSFRLKDIESYQSSKNSPFVTVENFEVINENVNLAELNIVQEKDHFTLKNFNVKTNGQDSLINLDSIDVTYRNDDFKLQNFKSEYKIDKLKQEIYSSIAIKNINMKQVDVNDLHFDFLGTFSLNKLIDFVKNDTLEKDLIKIVNDGISVVSNFSYGKSKIQDFKLKNGECKLTFELVKNNLTERDLNNGFNSISKFTKQNLYIMIDKADAEVINKLIPIDKFKPVSNGDNYEYNVTFENNKSLVNDIKL